MIIYDLLTDSTAAIVSLGDAKLHCKVDNDADDPLISNLITAAKKTFEKFANRALFNQTWVASFDYYDFVKCKNYFLPYGKIQSVTSVVTYDTENNPTTIDPVNYRTFANRFIFNSNYTLLPQTQSNATVSSTNPYNKVIASTTQSVATQLESWKSNIVKVVDTYTAYLELRQCS